MFSIIAAAQVFFAYFVLDVLFAYYTLCVTKSKPVKAATTAAIMYVLMAVGITHVLENWWYLVPLMLGSWLGTYLMVKYYDWKK